MEEYSLSKDTNNKIVSIEDLYDSKVNQLVPPYLIRKVAPSEIDTDKVAKDMQMGYMRMLSNQSKK